MKKTVLYTALFALAMPISVDAIGLGNMTVKSALDQPFVAEIELIDVGSTPLAGIKTGLADPHNFDEIGIERTAVLSLLNFSIGKNSKGKYIIFVQSKERMTEPYMELVVDLTWPQGQLYKAYTVLLDPPGYQLVSTPAQSGSTYYKTVQKHSHEPGVINKTITTAVEHNTLSLNDSKKKATYGPTIAHENVWQIALRYKASEVILPQVVLAIVGANPDAFIKGNLNGLKTGVRLVIPGTDEIKQIPADLATEEIMAHDKAWNEKTPINHVLSPPFMNGITAVNVPAQPSQIPIIPKIKQQAEPKSGSANQLIFLDTQLPVINNNQQQGVPAKNNQDSIDQDATRRAELSITTAAIESVRESNALLMEQLRLLQDQNKNLHQQLNKRTKELERLQAQVRVLIKQRQAVAAQASSSPAKNSTHSFWPFVLLMVVAAGCGGIAYWYFVHRKPTSKESPYITEPPLEPKTSIPLVEPVIVSVEQPASEVHPSVEDPSESAESLQKEIKKDATKSQDISFDEATPDQVAQDKSTTITELGSLTELDRPTKSEEITNSQNQTESGNLEEIEEPVELIVEDESSEPQKENSVQPEQSLISVSSAQEAQTIEDNDQELPVASSPEAELSNSAVLEFEPGLHEVLKEQAKQQVTSKNTPEDADHDMSLDFVLPSEELPEPEVSVASDEHVKEDHTDHQTSLENSSKPTEHVDGLNETAQSGVTEMDLDKSLTDFFVEPGQQKLISDEPDNSAITADNTTADESVHSLKSTKALSTLLDLAKTYIGMDDFESARNSLQEVLEFGNEEQKAEARTLIEQIKGR
ncbi:FimV/HubP family polar landmark protein [Legionella worsleiensis]|uniref:FimV protein n=1 Tax=Legionella worsleiensis TaxID=45076 RepID=A0A0W1AKY1_9GAMM|nr:FimV/HubP family polar landmark protein [Legionella worsleiensis]KTD82012.1 FimV protein [Legionella worsleiensis]STY30340.1 FimV protein [Legionella worsleiensis]